MGVVWPDYDTFNSRSVCINTPSIYIIMARLARIAGLEWSKIYEKLHSVLIWSLQKGAAHWSLKTHRSKSNQSIVYSSSILWDIYSLHLNCFQWCRYKQGKID